MPVPKVSIILIGYKMPTQLQKTLETLSTEFQRGVRAEDFEVILVENRSTQNLPEAVVEALPENVRYFLRDESGHTPVPAINFAFEKCRGTYIGLIMDGARMLTPGVIDNALKCLRLDSNILGVVPGYHLGMEEQHEHDDPEVALREEAQLLDSVDWRRDGYELFRISTWSGANRNGYLHPIMECNCLFASRDNYEAIGYANTDFTLRGGGSINLHIYRSLGMLPHTRVFVWPGEGSFHQYHGGVTTSSYDDRQAEIERHRTQLHSYWPGGFHALRREPVLFGGVPAQAQPFLAESLQRCQNRLRKKAQQGQTPWPDDSPNPAKD